MLLGISVPFPGENMKKPAGNPLRSNEISELTVSLARLLSEGDRVVSLPGIAREELERTAELMSQIRLLMRELAFHSSVPDAFRELTAQYRDLEGKVKELRNDRREKGTS